LLMKRNNTQRGLTLMELLTSMVIAVITFSAIGYLVVFVSSQIAVFTERLAMYAQINLAMDDMRTRIPAAVKIMTPLTSDVPSMDNITFEADRQIYNITPDDLTDNVNYRYLVRPGKGFVVEAINKTTKNIESTDILIEAKYNPAANFTRNTGDEPNILTVILAANSSAMSRMPSRGLSRSVAKMEGVKLWFVDVKQ